MSTELVLSGNRPAFLPSIPSAGGSPFAAGLASGGLNIPTMSIRGKEFRLRMDDKEVNTRKRELQVVLVSARPAVSRRFYESAYTGAAADETQPPRCSSEDGVRPTVSAPINPTCAGCPNNEWGSATTATRVSKGKACSEFKRMVVYPVGLASEDRTPAPCVLDIPATSLKGLRDYIRLLERNGVDPATYVVELGFSDAEWPQLEFKPVRYVTEAEFAHVRRLQEDNDVLDAVGGPPALPPTTPAQPEVASQQVPAPAQPQPVAEPPKAGRGRPKVTKAPEPQEEEPVPFQSPPAAVEDADDMLAQLDALLKGGK